MPAPTSPAAASTAAPHLYPDDLADLRGDAALVRELAPERAPKTWIPRRVLVTPAALEWEHGRAIVARAEARGIPVERLTANRLTGLRGADARETYVRAKTTLAVVVSPPGARKLQPIPPSADFQFHLAEGCPAHCQYCYLAGSLGGPPVTRVFANLPEILEGLRPYAGTGAVTSTSRRRAAEGTTFEASCYTDPLGIEHLTGSLGETIRFFGAWDAPAPGVQLRFTTKFDAVDDLLAIDHRGRTRVRFSLNVPAITRRLEGGTASLEDRIRALGRMARAGYPVGITLAPIMPLPGWADAYDALLRDVAVELATAKRHDLTIECITHRFTPGSKDVLLSWYPKTELEMDEAQRAQKRTKFGSLKYVYRAERMREMRAAIERSVSTRLPEAQLLYWT